MNPIFKKILVFLLLCIFALVPFLVLAQEPDLNLPNPVGTTDPAEVITRVVKYALGLVGLIAVVMIIYGGFVWMTSGGNTDKIKKGKDTLIWAVFGLALIFFAYTIINFIFKVFTTAAGGNE